MKYPMNDIKIIMDALAEIDLADDSEDPVFTKPTAWREIKGRIKEEWVKFQEEKIQQKVIEKNKRLEKLELLIKIKRDKGENLP